MEQKTTVSIFGACVSRDLFAMQRPETYEVQQYVSFVSPLSAVMTPPINGIQLNPDKIEPGRESVFSRRNLALDCNKQVFSYLEQKPSEWLMLDFQLLNILRVVHLFRYPILFCGIKKN